MVENGVVIGQDRLVRLDAGARRVNGGAAIVVQDQRCVGRQALHAMAMEPVIERGLQPRRVEHGGVAQDNAGAVGDGFFGGGLGDDIHAHCHVAEMPERRDDVRPGGQIKRLHLAPGAALANPGNNAHRLGADLFQHHPGLRAGDGSGRQFQ